MMKGEIGETVPQSCFGIQIQVQRLDIVDVDLPFVSELECTFTILFSEGVSLIDLGILGEFPVCFYWRKRGRQTEEG